MMLGLTVVALVVLYVMFQYWKVHRTRQKFPPGPFPLPLLGNLWEMKFVIHGDSIDKFAKIYGNIYTVWLKETPLIVLNGFHAVKDGLTSYPDNVVDRPVSPFYRDLVQGKGIAFTNGPVWKEQRRFGMSTLRTLGMGKRSLEVRIQEEACYLVELMKNEGGRPFNPWFALAKSVMNVISSVIRGHRFSDEDEMFHQLMKASFSFKAGGAPYKLYDIFPWIMPYLPGSHKKEFANYEAVRSFIRKEIKIHRENGNPGDLQDLIDHYLAQMEKNAEDNNSSFVEANMVQSITDLFIGGSETTTTTLYWALLHMVTYPDIQDKVRKELEDILGTSQVISNEDREKVPYTNAVLHEIQRYSKVIHTGFRTCVRDTTLSGYKIPKDTIIVYNMASVLQDPKHWKNPTQFDPNNFLDESGKFVSREAFLPFMAGNRVCIGEKFARTELFIFFAILLRTFIFRLPEGAKPINTQPLLGNVLVFPHPYQLCAVPC